MRIMYLTVIALHLICGSTIQAQGFELPEVLTRLGIAADSTSTIPSGATITRAQAVGLSLGNNPRLHVRKFDAHALSEAARQAKLNAAPTASAEVEDMGRGQEGGPSQSTFSVEQTFSLWGKRGSAHDAALARSQSAGFEWQAEALAIFTEVSAVYVALIGNQVKLTQTSARLQLARETETAVRSKFHEGAVPESEVLRAAAARSLAEIDSINAQGAIRLSRTELESLVGRSLPEVVASDSLQPADTLLLPADLTTAIESHPLVLSKGREEEASRQDIRFARASGKSDISFNAGYRRIHDSRDNAFLVGVAFPLPLRNPARYAVAESEFRLASAESRTQVTVITLLGELQSLVVSWLQRHSEATLIESQTLPAIEQSLASVNFAYRIGQQPYMSLLDVQRVQSELQSRLVDAKVELLQLEAAIEALLGQPIQTQGR